MAHDAHDDDGDPLLARVRNVIEVVVVTLGLAAVAFGVALGTADAG